MLVFVLFTKLETVMHVASALDRWGRSQPRPPGARAGTLTAILLVLLLGQQANAGGDDHFGGNETSAHSDYGGRTGYGSMSGRGSAWSGGGDFSLDRLSQVDHIGPGGSHVVDTYSVDGFTGRATFVSRSEDGGFDTYRVVDETVRGGYRLERRAVPPAPAPRPAPPAPVAAPVPAPEPLLPAPEPVVAAPVPEPPPPAPPPEIPNLVAPSPRLVIETPPPGKRVAPELRFEDALRAIEQHALNPRTGPLTQDEQNLARAINLAAGAIMGVIGGGKAALGPNGAGRLGGAILGAAVAEAKREIRQGKTPFDEAVRDLTTFDREEMDRAIARARSLSPEARGRLARSVEHLMDDPPRTGRVRAESGFTAQQMAAPASGPRAQSVTQNGDTALRGASKRGKHATAPGKGHRQHADRGGSVRRDAQGAERSRRDARNDRRGQRDNNARGNGRGTKGEGKGRNKA